MAKWLLLTNFPNKISANVLQYNSPTKFENWIKKRERTIVVTLNTVHAKSACILLNNSPHLKFENWIGEKKKKGQWLLLTNCPREISMYYEEIHAEILTVT